MSDLLHDLTILLAYLNVPAKLDRVLANQEKIMSVLTDLQASVAAEDTAIDSAITLLEGLSAALKAAGTDPVALAALKADIDAKTQSLAAAVVANTPAAP